MFAKLLNLSLLVLPIATLASYHGNPILNRHHQDIARRADGHVELFKRVTGGRWSFYNVETGNAGSCGQFHKNSDFTVAMNVAQMNKGTMCFKTIRMTYNGRTTTASVTDTCPGCPYGGLDLTEGLFTFFAPQSVGIIYGDWEFSDGSSNPAPAPAPAPPKPTTTWRPTSTWHPPPPPTTTRKSTTPTPTTSSTKASSSSRASSSASSSASVDHSSAALAAPSGTIDRTPGKGENLADLTQAFLQLGGIAVAGAHI